VPRMGPQAWRGGCNGRPHVSYWRKHLHYHHPQRAYDRWLGETFATQPKITYAERQGQPFPHPLEIEWLKERRALLPEEAKEWMWVKEAAAAPTERVTTVAQSAATIAPKLTATLTPEERHQRKLPHLTAEERRARKNAQTKLSNQRLRAERKAAKLATDQSKQKDTVT
jgi:hypothetical protein